MTTTSADTDASLMVECNETTWKTELRHVVRITEWKKSDKNPTSLYRIALSVGPGSDPLFEEMLGTVSVMLT